MFIVNIKIDKYTENWNLTEVQEFLKSTKVDLSYIKQMHYRLFDIRFIYYSKNKGVVARPLYKTMRHILEIENNIGLITTRFLSSDSFKHILVSSNISEMHTISKNDYIFPLYIKKENQGVFGDEEILSYIYSVLYSEIYRTKFIEHLRIDSPKII